MKKNEEVIVWHDIDDEKPKYAGYYLVSIPFNPMEGCDVQMLYYGTDYGPYGKIMWFWFKDEWKHEKCSWADEISSWADMPAGYANWVKKGMMAE